MVADSAIVEYMPLKKYEFSSPDQYSFKPYVISHEDYFKTASSKEIVEENNINPEALHAVRIQNRSSAEESSTFAVGQIPYQEDVTPSGGRVYNVPIMVPPIAKAPPQISLQYNSQNGNGTAGYGWDIGGLSSIRLINKNLYYHDIVSPANVSDTLGVYMLDGVALVQNDDSTLSSEYPLETARGHILVRKCISGSVVTHFEVLYPDGSKATFGMESTDSARSIFPITSWEDKVGNRILFSYSGQNSEYYIQSIQYGHKDNLTNMGSIDFAYSTRDDSYPRYYACQEGIRNKLLKNVTTYFGGNRLCEYELIHEYKNGVNLLSSILCFSATGEQLSPLRFTYGSDPEDNTSAADFIKTDSLILTSFFPTSGHNDFIYVRGKYLPNSYKDGLLILPEFSTYDIIGTTNNGSYKMYGSKYSPDQKVLVATKFDEFTDVDNSISVGSGFQYISAADVDNDGTDEIIKVNFGGTSTSAGTTLLNITSYGLNSSNGSFVQECSFVSIVNGIVRDGNLTSPMPRCYHMGDFSGSGMPQLLTISYSEDPLGAARTSSASLIDFWFEDEIYEGDFLQLAHEDEIFCIDMDGDGKTEVAHATSGGLKIYNYTNGQFVLTRSIGSLTSSVLNSSAYHLCDLNGDGYVDILREPIQSAGAGSFWTCHLFTGNGFESQSIDLGGRNEGDVNHLFDINKDGLPDLIQRNGTIVTLYKNENGTFVYENRIVSASQFGTATQFVPCNMLGYDMMSDFITVENHNVNVYGFSEDLSAERLLTGFTNSLGAKTVNDYADMASSNSVYFTDPFRAYNADTGFMKSRFPLQLLYNSQNYIPSSDNSYECLHNLYYSYFDACVHTKGLGFCGFGKVRSTDFVDMADEEPVSIETRDPERMGMTIRQVRGHRMTQDNPYDIIEYTYDTHATSFGKSNPRLRKIVHTDTLTSVVTTKQYTYGLYDFPVIVSLRRTTGSDTSVESHTYGYNHVKSADEYNLGILLSDLKMTSIPTTGEIWAEKQVYTYNSMRLPVTSIQYVGEDDTLLSKVSETRWTYDSYGNILSESSAPYNATEFVGKTYTYDGNGVMLMSMTDELGRTTTYSNHNKFGHATTTKDYANRTTTDMYDDLGNHISRRFPDGTGFDVVSEWGGQAAYTVTTVTAGKPRTIVHYDAAGREVRNGTLRFDGQWVFVDTVYDVYGQIEKVSLPFRSTSASLWNEYEYDRYLRPVSFTEASGKTTEWSYDGTSTTEVKNGVWSIKTKNSRGNLKRVQDAGGVIEYTLRPDGQPSMVSVQNGGATILEYDRFGRRTRIIDSSAGEQTDSVAYNPDGSSVSTHINPNGTIITRVDKFGRVTKIERPGEYTTDYVYDTNGLLLSETSSNGTSKTYEYDAYDRVSLIQENVPDGKYLRKAYVYRTDGNVSRIIYMSQNGIICAEDYVYSRGMNVAVKIDGTYIRNIRAENEFGHPTIVNTVGHLRNYSYDIYGFPTRRKVGAIMDQTYSFDHHTGNLLHRTDNIRNIEEQFQYDNLNRLTGINDRSIIYSANGNIINVDGVGEMIYDDQMKPYQVTSLIPEDDIIQPRAQTVSYTCYSRPSTIIEGGRSAAFTYNGDGERVKMNIAEGSQSVLSRYYIGNRYELDVTPAGNTERLYLDGDAYSAPAVLIRTTGSSWTLHTICRDYLGNITHIVAPGNTVVEENSYDPWGRLRNPETHELHAPGTEPELMLGRGYTGHEHLTWFGLINMNARLYDPLIGRFLSPDPFVQMPDFTQNFNRYSYCLNNPLVYVDESGEVIGTTFTFLWDLCKTLIDINKNKGNEQAINEAWRRFDPTAPWSKTNKALKIALGGLMIDENKTFKEQRNSIISRWTLELPQTILGKFYSHYRNLTSNVDVSYYHEATIVDVPADDPSKSRWGVTLGSFINTFNENRDLIRHEYGHVIQSKKIGPLYIPLIGIPSIIGCEVEDISNHDHDYEWYETWANKLSYEYLTIYDAAGLRKNPWDDTKYSRNYNLNWYFYLTLGYYAGLLGLSGLLFL